MSGITVDSPRGALEANEHPHVSIIIPVYNEEANLPLLFTRLYTTLDALACSWECVFVDDGSKDRSVALLRAQYQLRPQHTRVIVFRRNFGQHSAIMAGFEAATAMSSSRSTPTCKTHPRKFPTCWRQPRLVMTMSGRSQRTSGSLGAHFSVAAHQRAA